MKKRKNPRKDIDAVNVIVRPKVPGPWVMLASQPMKATIGTRLEIRPLSNAERAGYMPPDTLGRKAAARARALAKRTTFRPYTMPGRKRA